MTDFKEGKYLQINLTPWMTVIEGRSPRVKMHTSRAAAANAVTMAIRYSSRSSSDIGVFAIDTAPGIQSNDWELVWSADRGQNVENGSWLAAMKEWDASHGE